MADNAASRRVMEKCGLTLARSFPYEGGYPVDGAARGEVEYALNRAQWEQARAAGA
jgi:RimJ/RimL family protein N-acetyltransferase